MRFVWNDEKSRSNLQKHGLSFGDAEQVFSGPCVTFEERNPVYYLGRTGWSDRRHCAYPARRRNADHLNEKGKKA